MRKIFAGMGCGCAAVLVSGAIALADGPMINEGIADGAIVEESFVDGAVVDGPMDPLPGYWQPGGYEARVGSPYYYNAPGVGQDPRSSVATVDLGAGQRTEHCPCEDGRPGYAARPAVTSGPMSDPHLMHDPALKGVLPVQPPVTVQNFPYQSLPKDPYSHHFGPGFYRHTEYGHYRFPYYTYRAPWYFPGHPIYNRDTNFVW